jgi:hypothetical protein
VLSSRADLVEALFVDAPLPASIEDQGILLNGEFSVK